MVASNEDFSNFALRSADFAYATTVGRTREAGVKMKIQGGNVLNSDSFCSASLVRTTMTETASHSLQGSSSSNVVGVHYRVGKKIGEGSFGVIFQGSFAPCPCCALR